MNYYMVAKPFGAYMKGDKVQFSDEDAQRFAEYLAPAEAPAVEDTPAENKKAPKARKK
jgi:hypothetical protein